MRVSFPTIWLYMLKTASDSNNQLVLRTEGMNLARSFQSTQIETSAKARINVDETFHELVRAIRKFNKVGSFVWYRHCLKTDSSLTLFTPLFRSLTQHRRQQPEAPLVPLETELEALPLATSEAVQMTLTTVAASVSFSNPKPLSISVVIEGQGQYFGDVQFLETSSLFAGRHHLPFKNCGFLSCEPLLAGH